jgi:hypothetical protein
MACPPVRSYRRAIAFRYLVISRFISGTGGSTARPSSRSATHCDWASATGMIAPIGWTSPMKYRPGSAGAATRR